MRHHGLAVVLVLLLGTPALRAAPEPPAAPAPPPTPAQAAVEIVKAVEARDAAALAALAARDDPDPWLVVDALLLEGARAAAEAFAKAAPRKDVEKLPEFVAAWSAAEPDSEARRVLAEGNAALTGRRFDEALRAFDTVPAAAMPFLRARIAFGRALAFVGLGKASEAGAAFGAASVELEAMGWLSRASEALRRSAAQAASLPDPAAVLDPLRRLARLEAARGSSTALIHVWMGIADYEGRSGRWAEAAQAHRQALDLATERQERALMARAWNGIGWDEAHLHHAQEAHAAVERSQAISEPLGLAALTAHSHEIHAMAYLLEGKLGLSATACGEAVKFARSAGEPALLARMLYALGNARCDLSAYEQALEPLQQALAGFEAIDPTSGTSVTLARARYAWCLALAGKAAEARPLADRAAADAGRSTRFTQGIAHWAQGTVLEKEGKHDEAVQALLSARAHLEAARELDDALRVAVAMAEVRLAQGSLPEARSTADSALTSARRFPKGLALPLALAVSARVRLAQGAAKEAQPLATEARDAFSAQDHANGVNAARLLLSEIEAALPK